MPFSSSSWLVVFYVPSTARSFRDGTPIYCALRRRWSSVFCNVTTANWNLGHRVAVHYTTAAPRQLHSILQNRAFDLGNLYTIMINEFLWCKTWLPCTFIIWKYIISFNFLISQESKRKSPRLSREGRKGSSLWRSWQQIWRSRSQPSWTRSPWSPRRPWLPTQQKWQIRSSETQQI